MHLLNQLLGQINKLPEPGIVFPIMPVDKRPDFGFFLIPWLKVFGWNLGDFSSLRPRKRKKVVFRVIKVVVFPCTECLFKTVIIGDIL